MKRFLVLLIVLTIVISAIGVSADSGQVRRLTLEEAQDIALANSIKYQLQDSYISDALQNYYDTQDSSEKMSGSRSSGMMNYFNKTITPEISVDSAANSVRLSRFEKEDIKRASNYNVEVAFIDIMKAQMDMESKKNDTSIKLKDYEAGKVKLEVGLLTKDELKVLEKSYSDSIAAQQVAFTSLRSEYQALNKYLGRAVNDYNLEIVYELEKFSLDDIDLDKIREANIKNNKNFYSLEQSVTLAKRKYDLTKERYEHFEKLGVKNSKQDMLDAYSDAERDYDEARKSFEDATKDLDISLNSNYHSLKNLIDSADRLERDIADFKVSMEKTKLRYDLGLISRIDYDKQQTTLNTMENSLKSLLADLDKQYISLMLYVE